MNPFVFTSAGSGPDPQAVRAAQRQAWNACSQVACPKCHVPAGQHCRDRVAGTEILARFHKPRQDAANAPSVLGPVGIHGLSWSKVRGQHPWRPDEIPQL
ncbi:zinc finger domain-containing protein [Streptomyces sp. NPDC002624]